MFHQKTCMDDKLKTKCPPSLTIRETKIKTTMRYNYSPIRKTNIKNMAVPSVGQDVEI